MINKYFTLIGRIEQELSEIKKSVERATRAWEKARELGDFLYLDSVALNLHDFYSGLERIFERIAEDIDEIKPSGNSWHQELLKQMATEIPRVRPAVISGNLLQTLDEYRAFRHIVRNVYAHNFKMDRIQKLVENAEEVFKEAEEELHGFCEFLKKLHIN
jgi:hypothetical protein